MESANVDVVVQQAKRNKRQPQLSKRMPSSRFAPQPQLRGHLRHRQSMLEGG